MLESLFDKVGKRLQHSCFPVNIAKIFRTAFFKEHLQWLLLKVKNNNSIPKRQSPKQKVFREDHKEHWVEKNWRDRSSHRSCSVKKGVLKNFAKFTGKHLCQCIFFIKVAGLRPATLLKMRLWHRCFPVNFVKFLRTPFFIEHLWWLLLQKACHDS